MGSDLARLALGIAILLVAAKVGGHLAERRGQVAVLGELLAGILLANLSGSSLHWLRDDPAIDVLAKLGSLVLLFEVGLDLTVREILDVGRPAAVVAVVGTCASIALGTGAAVLLRRDDDTVRHLFVGAALSATSIGITARVLKDMNKTRTPEARIVLGAAVLDDVLGLVILAVVNGAVALGVHGKLSATRLVLIVGKALLFFAAAFAFGIKLTPSLFGLAARLRTRGAQVAVGLGFCFFLSWAADVIGLAPIIGAFTAGLILEDAHSARFVARGERALADLVEPVSAFLVPIFFVVTGLHVNLRALASREALTIAGVFLLAAVLGKLVTASVVRRASPWAVGFGMVPRGEVTLIYATLGQGVLLGGRPLLDEGLYSALVATVVGTTLVAPPAIKWAFRAKTDTT